MAQTKETNLQETKEKLKQVANHWIELQELSKSAIYDIRDPNIDWNKEVKIADIESIDEKTKVEDSKPEKKSEEPPKKPKKKNNILSVIMFILSSSIYIVSWILLSIADNCREYLDGQNSILFMLSRFITIIAIIIFTIGLVLLDKIATTKKCKKIISQNNIEITKKEQKFIDKFSKKYVSILSTTFMCICPVLLCACINIGSYGLNTMLECILSFFSIAVIGLGVVLIFKHKTKFLLDQLNYKVALNEIEENKKYNVEQYPILLKEYVDNINKTHRKIADIYNQIYKINIISISQAKYAQLLLDYIYKGAESIKEAFQMLELDIAENRISIKIEDEQNASNNNSINTDIKISGKNKYIKGEKNMIYNKTKRILELVASIFGVVSGTGMLATSLYLFIEGIILAGAFAAAGLISFALPFLIPGIIFLATSVCTIVFSALLIKSPVRPEGVLNTKSKQICFIVFSILSGNIVSFVLEIVVVCLPNFVDQNKYAEHAGHSKYIQPNPQFAQTQQSMKSQYTPSNSIESKINELKHLKELGVIDEQTYNKAVDKIISEIK